MEQESTSTAVKIGFETNTIIVNIADIHPLKMVQLSARKSPKYAKIAASIAEVGIVEPPVVARDPAERGKYLLLDGHLRIDVLKEMGETQVACLVSTDDEAFTYNKRISRLAVIQEHKMIVKAVQRGVSEQRLAKALNVDVHSIVKKRRLLEGICPEVADILKDKHIAIHTFTELRKMCAFRQIEAAELMVAMDRFTVSYARSLVAATPQNQLVEQDKPKHVRGLTDEQIALMEREAVGLQREFRIAEKSYGVDHLDLVLAVGYVTKLLGNAKVVRYLAQHHNDILGEFQKLAELKSHAA